MDKKELSERAAVDTDYLDPEQFLVASHTICAFPGSGTGRGLLWRMQTHLTSQQAEGICEEQHFSTDEGDDAVLQGSLFKFIQFALYMGSFGF